MPNPHRVLLCQRARLALSQVGEIAHTGLTLQRPDCLKLPQFVWRAA